MSRPPESNHDLAAVAALYVAGAMTDQERAAFESRLAAGDRSYLEALKAMDPVVEALAQSAPAVTPSASVKDRLMAKIAAESVPQERPQVAAADANVFNLRVDEGDWQETGVEGVQFRVLYVDHEANRKTFLVRMAPGTTFPGHAHRQAEECYVIHGDLHSAGRVMRSGDYQRAPAGSQHGPTYSENGCLCLVVAAAA